MKLAEFMAGRQQQIPVGLSLLEQQYLKKMNSKKEAHRMIRSMFMMMDVKFESLKAKPLQELDISTRGTASSS